MHKTESEDALLTSKDGLYAHNYSEACMELALWLGYGLMANGAETIRVEDSVRRVLLAYGMHDAQVFAVSNYIHISARGADGEPRSYGKRLHGSSDNNLNKVDLLNVLARRITETKPDPGKTVAEIKNIISSSSYLPITHSLAVAVSALAFTLLIGGRLIPAIWAMLSSFVMTLILRPIRKRSTNKIFINIIGAILITLFAWPIRYTIYSQDAIYMMTGSFMYFFPGIALINSTRDLMAGDYSAGMAKMVEAVLLAVSVAIGSAATLAVLGSLWPIN